MTKKPCGALVDSSFKPSCCSIAVKIDGDAGTSELGSTWHRRGGPTQGVLSSGEYSRWILTTVVMLVLSITWRSIKKVLRKSANRLTGTPPASTVRFGPFGSPPIHPQYGLSPGPSFLMIVP